MSSLDCEQDVLLQYSMSRKLEKDDMVEPPPPVPRWVKVLAAIAALVVAVAILLMAIGGGEHGPGRHVLSPGASPATV